MVLRQEAGADTYNSCPNVPVINLSASFTAEKRLSEETLSPAPLWWALLFKLFATGNFIKSSPNKRPAPHHTPNFIKNA